MFPEELVVKYLVLRKQGFHFSIVMGSILSRSFPFNLQVTTTKGRRRNSFKKPELVWLVSSDPDMLIP
jgi:hypothetical protein